jgi:sarcosine oxidase
MEVSAIDVDAEFAVVGLGAMGSHALWRLAARGKDVIGFEQFRPGHYLGSTHGQTRLFRTLCLEHPGLVPLARRSLGLWRELEEESRSTIVQLTGGLMIGKPDSPTVRGVLKAAQVHGQDVRTLSAAELGKDYPQHAGIADDDVAVLDPDAGVARPEAAVLAATDAATRAGARLVQQVAVSGIELVDDGVVIRTAARDFRVRQAIVTPGPWLYQLFPALPMRPTRTPLTWFKAAHDPAAFDLARFPVFIRELPDGNRLWGHGAGADHDVKIGPEDDPNYQLVDPNTVDRYIKQADYAFVSQLVGEALPGLDPIPSATTTCMVTRTPDMQFLVGRPANDPRLLVGGGDSGHAFKHASGLGEALAQMACGEQAFTDLGFMNPTRYL